MLTQQQSLVVAAAAAGVAFLVALPMPKPSRKPELLKGEAVAQVRRHGGDFGQFFLLEAQMPSY